MYSLLTMFSKLLSLSAINFIAYFSVMPSHKNYLALSKLGNNKKKTFLVVLEISTKNILPEISWKLR